MKILTILILPAWKYEVAFHVCASISIPFISDSKFQLLRSSTSSSNYFSFSNFCKNYKYDCSSNTTSVNPLSTCNNSTECFMFNSCPIFFLHFFASSTNLSITQLLGGHSCPCHHLHLSSALLIFICCF